MINDDALVRYASVLGRQMVTLQDIREKQDPKTCDRIIQQAIQKLREGGHGRIFTDHFFLGSVDFMVSSHMGQKRFCIIETNGGNSRGISLLPVKYTKKACRSFVEMLRFLPKEPNILIGHLNEDKVIHEKFIVAEAFYQVIKESGEDAHFITIGPDTNLELGGAKIMMGAYPEILPRIRVDNGYAFIDDIPLHGIVGDGVIRRHQDLGKWASTGDLMTLFANRVYRTTDDKYSTYELIEKYSVLLGKYRIHPLKARLCPDLEELKQVAADFFKAGTSPVVIKPYGGSGGAGIYALDERADIEAILNLSMNEFWAKFGNERKPFPYTVVEAVRFVPMKWKKSERNFDIRIYVGRNGDEIIPMGLLMRIARSPFLSMDHKEGFVVNLSGYGGIETERGMGLSPESLDMFGLTETDVADMFAASCAVFELMQKEMIGGEKGADG